MAVEHVVEDERKWARRKGKKKRKMASKLSMWGLEDH